jgi:hypothetical protein
LLAEIIGGVALIAAVIMLWMHHDTKEQAIATTACVASEEKSGNAQLASTNTTNIDNANTLSQVVGTYDQKIAALTADRDSLAQRLHDAHPSAAVSSRAVPNISAPSGFVCRPADNTGPSDCDRREAVNLEACAANTIELIELRDAWQRIAHPAPPKN